MVAMHSLELRIYKLRLYKFGIFSLMEHDTICNSPGVYADRKSVV